MDILQNIQFSTDPTLLNNPLYRNINNIQPQSFRLLEISFGLLVLSLVKRKLC